MNEKTRWTWIKAVRLLLLLLLIILLAAGLIWRLIREETDETTANTITIEQSGGLVLSSVYTSSIQNPDCNGEYGEEIASLEVNNESGKYLTRAELTAVLSDGTERHFLVQDLPAGERAEIFETENLGMDSEVTCVEVKCDAEEYLDEEVMMSDTLTVFLMDTGVVITNIGEDDLNGITVVYRCDMDDVYFGGTSYERKIDHLEAGESYELTDEDLMSEIVVVRIYEQK